MKKAWRFISIAVVVILASSLFAVLPVSAGDSEVNSTALLEFPRNEMAPDGPDPMDLTVEDLGEKEIAIRELAAEVGPAIATKASPMGLPAEVGDEFTFTVSDDGLGIEYDEDFVVVREGTHGLILITEDAYDSHNGTTYFFANPIGDDSEPWLRSQDEITDAQLDYLSAEFDSTIYPTVTTIYGEPLPRGDEGQKIWTLLFNIRDYAYYNTDATSYAAGYFSASSSATNNKNIMHIDTFEWENRTGPAPHPGSTGDGDALA